MPQRFRQIAEIFREASLRDGDERAAYIDEACGADAELRVEVDRLLLADQQLPSAGARSVSGPRSSDLELPATSESPEHPRVETSPSQPSRIGRYTIKSVLGSGGMGTVYLAMQEQPRRRVALKVMKAGIASRSALRRFEFESQILGRLRHPGIAQVYEAGTHDDGSGGVPYFAMEYIPSAMPITEYAESKQLGTRQRLELFEMVCGAVNHGHQKGIIHRDLKPSNILVDSSGQPKIIDFGVARATDSDMAITTLQTDIGQLIGTLQYMSPEQCDADPDDLDIRSDVYALGVVLYELLCGCLPYDLTRVAIHEAARVIREDAPSKPSSIARELRGDVETVTMKAMEKDRKRRYGSAGELEGDIGRYLRSEPITARPPSLMYHFVVLLRRRLHGKVSEHPVRDGILSSGAAIGTLALAAWMLNLWVDSLSRGDPEWTEVGPVYENLARYSPLLTLGQSVYDQSCSKCHSLEHTVDKAPGFGETASLWGKERLLESGSVVVDADYVRSKVSYRDPYRVTGMPNNECTKFYPRMMGAPNGERVLTAITLYIKSLNPELEDQTRRESASDYQQHSAMSLRSALLDAGRDDYAEAYFRNKLEHEQRTLGPTHSETLQTQALLGGLLRRVGRLDEADRVGASALERARATYPSGERIIGVCLVWHGVSLHAMERREEAEAELAEAHSTFSEGTGRDPYWRMLVARELIRLHREWHEFDPEGGHDLLADVWSRR